MLRQVIAATAMLVVANCSNAFAQIAGEGEPGAQSQWHHHPSPEDMKAFTDARIAALKAGLQLTPDQEKNWPPFEQAIRDLAKLRSERMQAREEGMERLGNPFDRLQRRAEAMSRASTTLKHLADAGTPLYQSLGDAQKHRFMMLAHILRPHWMGSGGFWRGHHEMDGHGMRDMTGHDAESGHHGMMEPGEPHGDMDHDSDEEDL
jgi:zinc resistance-associated protein